MTNLIVTIHNTETGEIIERNMTANEIAAIQVTQAQAAANRLTAEIEAATKATEKAALLHQLGITEEQAKLLLS